MTEARIVEARREAHRFIRTVEALLNSPSKNYEIVGSKLSGAVRRASLDLTRSLSAMRNER